MFIRNSSFCHFPIIKIVQCSQKHLITCMLSKKSSRYFFFKCTCSQNVKVIHDFLEPIMFEVTAENPNFVHLIHLSHWHFYPTLHCCTFLSSVFSGVIWGQIRIKSSFPLTFNNICFKAAGYRICRPHWNKLSLKTLLTWK